MPQLFFSGLFRNIFLFAGSLVFFQNLYCQLPEKSLQSRFRIKVWGPTQGNNDTLKLKTKKISDDLRCNAYLVQKKGSFMILAGDFTRKQAARNKLARFRRNYKKAGISKDCNEFVTGFQIYSRKKLGDKPLVVRDSVENHLNVSPEKDIINAGLDEKKTMYGKWNNEIQTRANTAFEEDYLTENEKKVIYYLNLVRMEPKLFAETILIDRIGEPDSENEISLFRELFDMQPLPCLLPNKQCWESAKCHAELSGISGYVGHERQNCESYF